MTRREKINFFLILGKFLHFDIVGVRPKAIKKVIRLDKLSNKILT